MEKWNLRGENMVGIATDGANAMCGENHSLVALLKRSWPHLVHIKCTCHSIDLIAKNAVKTTLPSHIDYLIRESFNWFAHSSSRLQAYQEIAQLIGFSTISEEEEDGEEDEADSDYNGCQNKPPPRLISPSQTRWLVHADCIERILSQFDALKTHFNIAYIKEKCFAAKTLYEMYCDPKNYLYLLFLLPILNELKRLTKLFQSNVADILRVFGDLESAFITLSRRILKPAIISANSTEQLASLNLASDFCFLDPESVDLGSTFLLKLQKSSLTAEEKLDLKIRGKNFLKEVLIGFQKRLCGTLNMMKKIACFRSENFLSTRFAASNFPAPFFAQDQLSLSELEERAKLLQATNIESIKSGGTEAFWTAVHNYQDSTNSNPFHQLSSGVLKILCLPISNAEIERVFSQVTLLKNSKRSTMKSELLEAILYIKFGLSKFDKKVPDFKPTVEMLKFDSSIYD